MSDRQPQFNATLVAEARARAAAAGFTGLGADDYVRAYCASVTGGVLAERKRIATILRSPEVQGQEDRARYLAFSTDHPAALAIEMLRTPAEPVTSLDSSVYAARRLQTGRRGAGAY